MPGFNFKPRFAGAIRAGTKRQTIRALSKRNPRVGQTAYLYTGLRHGNGPATKLNEGPIVAVKRISIDPEVSYVLLEGEHLYGQALIDFVKADGFDSVREFFAFFIEVGRRKRFEAQVIYWDPQGNAQA